MNATEYQQAAKHTFLSEPDSTFTGAEQMLMWYAIGLTGEAGEIADMVKKGVCHQHGLDRLKIKEELGDLMWYVASIATLLHVDLGIVMESNIAKMYARYPNGYNSADSKARIDQIPALPQPTIGALDVCKMCGESIWYVGPIWDHQSENKPRHPATPVRHALGTPDYNPTL